MLAQVMLEATGALCSLSHLLDGIGSVGWIYCLFDLVPFNRASDDAVALILTLHILTGRIQGDGFVAQAELSDPSHVLLQFTVLGSMGVDPDDAELALGIGVDTVDVAPGRSGHTLKVHAEGH